MLAYLFAGITCINIGYYLYFSNFWLFAEKQGSDQLYNTKPKGVSVISCAQNESENLPKLIEALLNQEYSEFEIIFVNDHSTDESLAILQQAALQYKNFRVLNLDKEQGKKAGITKAISLARYNKLLFIDADCIPASANWLQLMTKKLNSKIQIVLGYGGYYAYPNSILNKLIRFETLFTAMQYFAYAKAKNTYMGIGRNLVFTKELFVKSDGFHKHASHKAGDDDLFVNQNASPHNVALCINPAAFTYSEPKTSWKSWFIQKRRHVGVAHLYKMKHQLQLGIFYASQFLFYYLALILIFSGFIPLWVLVFILLRELIAFTAIQKASSRLREKNLAFYILILEPLMISVQMLIFISTIVAKPRRWN